MYSMGQIKHALTMAEGICVSRGRLLLAIACPAYCQTVSCPHLLPRRVDSCTHVTENDMAVCTTYLNKQLPWLPVLT